MTINHGCSPKCAICLANTPSLPSGLDSDRAFCNGEIAEAESDIERAKRRIAFFQREIARIDALIEKCSK
jgi:hypothetical protein